jgi:hypothetical protein
VQLQQSRQQQTELIAVMRKDLHRALSTVQAVTVRCNQLMRDRNLFQDQKRSLEQLIGSFISGVAAAGPHVPQSLHEAVESFAAMHSKAHSEEANALENGNSELMDLLRSIWGNADGHKLAQGDQPTPAIARVEREFQIESGTPNRALQKDLTPAFSLQPETSNLEHNWSKDDLGKTSAAPDAEYDEISQFLLSRVSSSIHSREAGTGAQDTAALSRLVSHATGNSSRDELAEDGMKVQSTRKLPQDSEEAAASKGVSFSDGSAKQTSSERLYKDLQIQLHASDASETPRPQSATCKASSIERGAAAPIESRRDEALASARCMRASLIDPVTDSEKLHVIDAVTRSMEKMQSSPRSSTDSSPSEPPVSTPSLKPQPATGSVPMLDPPPAAAKETWPSNGQLQEISSPKTCDTSRLPFLCPELFNPTVTDYPNQVRRITNCPAARRLFIYASCYRKDQ